MKNKVHVKMTLKDYIRTCKGQITKAKVVKPVMRYIE